MTERQGDRPELVSADTVREARDALRGLLDRVGEGTLTSPPVVIARLEGAIAALDAVLAQRDSANYAPATD